MQEHGFPVGGLDSYCTPDELLALYDLYGVERGVLLPEVNPEGLVQTQSNEEVLRMAKACDRFIPFCNIDPRALAGDDRATMSDLLRYYRDRGCCGLGEVTANLHFLDPRVQCLFKAAEEVGFSVTFHISTHEGYSYGLVDGPGLSELETCLQLFPKLKFFGHSQAFWCEMSAYDDSSVRTGYPTGPVVEEGAVPRLMRRYPNLYGDLSANSGAMAIIRDRAYGVRFLNEFQDRLFFGMDLCQPKAERSLHALLPTYLRELRDTGEISEKVFAKVGRENAIRVLGL